MRHLRQFFNVLLARIRGCRKGRPEDIPKKLPPEALAQALMEARFLMGVHGVDVRALAAGEKPQIPRSADGNEPPMPEVTVAEMPEAPVS